MVVEIKTGRALPMGPATPEEILAEANAELSALPPDEYGGEESPFIWPENAEPEASTAAPETAASSSSPEGGEMEDAGRGVPTLLPLRLAAMLARNTPLPAEIIDGYCYQGEVSMLAGPPKSKKTWAMLNAAVCVSAGVPFLGKRCVQGEVLYLNTEVAEPFWEERCRNVARALGVSDPAFYSVSTRGRGLTMFNVIPAIETACRKFKIHPRMICIDPWYTLAVGLDENAAGDVARVMLQLQSLAESLGAAVWFAHHFTKGDSAKKAQIDRASGSGAFARAVDNLLTLTPAPGGNGGDPQTVLEVTRRNAVSPPSLRLGWKFPLLESLGEAVAPTNDKPSAGERGRPQVGGVEDARAAFEIGEMQLRHGEIVSRLMARGMSEATAKRRLKEAVEVGELEHCGEFYCIPAGPPVEA